MDDVYVGIREETNYKKDESLLRQHACPSCGNVDILTGDEEIDQDVKPLLRSKKLLCIILSAMLLSLWINRKRRRWNF